MPKYYLLDAWLFSEWIGEDICCALFMIGELEINAEDEAVIIEVDLMDDTGGWNNMIQKCQAQKIVWCNGVVKWVLIIKNWCFCLKNSWQPILFKILFVSNSMFDLTDDNHLMNWWWVHEMWCYKCPIWNVTPKVHLMIVCTL